jgi:hypothetical protein
MIYANLGGQLKELDLEFHGIRERLTVVSQLIDLPVLKKLHLFSPTMSIQDLVEMHRNVSSIQRFVVEFMKVKGGVIMLNITLAISLTTFECIHPGCENTSIHAQLYKYMAKIIHQHS